MVIQIFKIDSNPDHSVHLITYTLYKLYTYNVYNGHAYIHYIGIYIVYLPGINYTTYIYIYYYEKS